MTYHISDVKQYNRCPRLFMLNQTHEPEPFQPFIRLDETVTDLAKIKLGIGDCFTGKRGDDAHIAPRAMESYRWLIKARFEADGLRIKVPFLHLNNEGKWDVYFLFIGLYPHMDDMVFYTSTIWVLEKNNIQIGHVYILHLNAEYQREEELDPSKLFVCTEQFYNDKNNPSHNVLEMIRKHMKDYEKIISRMNDLQTKEIPEPKRVSACSRRQKCRYYDDCFAYESKISDRSILLLTGAQKRFEMKSEGLHHLADADGERIEGTGMQYAQIMADKMGGLFVDKLALKSFLSGIQYPISFIDFEWERFAIPPYKGMRPYDVMLFEYSLHILEEDGTIKHHAYLSTHDDRQELAMDLIQHLPKEGSVIAYNAFGAEVIRINELGEQFPELNDQLQQINARMKDLQMPFVNGLVYDLRMRGNWSLKSIMGFMDDEGYQNLDIRQGMDAVYQWRILDKDMDPENAQQIYDDLIAYCGMDTYAMVKVYQWLLSITES